MVIRTGSVSLMWLDTLFLAEVLIEAIQHEQRSEIGMQGLGGRD